MTLAPGTKLGPYEILAPLGAGGMGEVYRARDLKLEREVALKILPPHLLESPEAKARFHQEALAVASLNHPNVMTLFEAQTEGEMPYLAMELLEGETLRDRLLRGPLSLPELRDVALQMVRGLKAAHAKGIIHRDLKPQNVIILTDGRVKLLDFGLAKRAPLAATADHDTLAIGSDPRTEQGIILGTLGYLSPEQAKGEPATPATDQFSLGAMLFELATGKPAFHGANAVETLSAILRDTPDLSKLGEAQALEPILQRLLEKDPAKRYPSLSELEAEFQSPEAASSIAHPAIRALLLSGASLLCVLTIWFWRRTPRPVPEKSPTVLVLPLENIGGRSEDEYFSDGLTDVLQTDLGQVPGLTVISRSASFLYKGKHPAPQSLAKSLGVTHILEGRVQRAGSRVRLIATLTDAASGRQIWSDRLDRDDKNVFLLQDDLSRAVSHALRLTLQSREGRAPTRSPEAYDLYLRALYHEANDPPLTYTSDESAIPLLERALAIDNGFALAHATLARALSTLVFLGGDKEGALQARALSEVEKALALDPNLAEAYQARAALNWSLPRGFRHAEALRDLHRAIALNPNSPAAWDLKGAIDFHVGFFDEAIQACETLARLDPGYPPLSFALPWIHFYQGRFEKALVEYQQNEKNARNPEVPLLMDKLGRTEEGLALAKRVLADGQAHIPTRWEAPSSEMQGTAAVLLARLGRRTEAEQYITLATQRDEGLSHFHHTAYNIACAQALLNHPEEAMKWLRRTSAEGMPCYPLFAQDHYLDGLRNREDFKAFLAESKKGWETLRRDTTYSETGSKSPALQH